MEEKTRFALAALAFALAASLALSGCVASQINEGTDANGRAYRGADNPKIVMYEHSDFECPYCARVQPTVEEIVRSYPQLRLEYRHYPITSSHPHAFSAAVASVCAE